ncbi:MAG: OsmC family protein [Promethearchaeota archaeon]
MAEEEKIFKIECVHQGTGQEDENLLHRLNTITVPDNDSQPEIIVQVPVSYNGPKGDNNKEIYYTPEHLFLSGVSGCFINTFSVIANNSNLKFLKIVINTEGKLEKVNGITQMTEIKQNIELTVPNTEYEKKGKKILEMTERYCPLANSVKSKIQNTYKIHIVE